ncbi:hypothetical protein BD410DRAFT_898039 [Rickenella mellea]|uniref:BHLH domain-containing protein n=1 Tax=Rickenella mellea TaxID=50990 RepID=A0A4Y7Q6H2_9AGAM|nr:hypothetical protein BD410DRAFT_898039 [Rickenella mellea]
MDGQNDDFMAPFDIAGFVAASERMQHQDNSSGNQQQHDVFQRQMSSADNDEPPMMSLQSASSNTSNNMESYQALLAIQAMENQQQQSQPSTTTQSLLEQQLRLNQLQQLQQLQNQIFQQQIELISGQSGMAAGMDTGQKFGDQINFTGLPTPASSTELRAQVNTNFVSPMILQNYIPPPVSSSMSRYTSSSHNQMQGSNSAPAHIAFHVNTPLPSPAELDFDLSPLTSPWLGAYQQSDQSSRPKTNKRDASSSGDDTITQSSRKRQSPAIRPSNGSSSAAIKRAGSMRGSASLNSTPALRSRSRKGSTAGDEPGDTPSPVDLSMPPPAPPSSQQNASVPTPTQSTNNSTSPSPSIAPVTPASIMNLGRFGLASGLSPPMTAADNNNASKQPALGNKSKQAARPKVAISANGSKLPKKSPSGSMISPSLKPLLPGGLPASSAAHLAAHSNYSHHMAGNSSQLNLTPSTPLPQPTLQVRKTSHKAAEQKRRDSLKTSFDDLRMLLPPIPLPSDEGYDGEPPLPGAMPPRGPPRGDGGPNRAVSKLQLLRCGNDFIRQLKARIDRRDEFIEQLKSDVIALRGAVGPDVSSVLGRELADLDLDLDAIEAQAPRLGFSGSNQDEDYGEEEGGE